MNKKNNDPHSAHYFNDARDFWWNSDFLQLMANRLCLQDAQTMLDVGCGLGHWGLLLLPFLHPEARLMGVEPEKKWRVEAKARAKHYHVEGKASFVEGTAENLPFADDSFDVVTCQTLLIHVENPMAALLEMKRVLKPGGLLLTSEPNNLVQQILLDSVHCNSSIEETTSLFKFQLTCERGKAIINEGSNLIGDLLPYLFSEAKLQDIQCYLSDMADFYIPPYQSPRQKAGIESLKDSISKGYYVWSKEETERFYLAGGGTPAEFIEHWKLIENRGQEYLKAIQNNQYYTSGGIMHYLTSGRKNL
ncbi:MAG: class I SAM-dependent methyltransferase [Legionella sp.]|nr:class I SAM-dependent methyltransferase [Legionella sp.]